MNKYLHICEMIYDGCGQWSHWGKYRQISNNHRKKKRK